MKYALHRLVLAVVHNYFLVMAMKFVCCASRGGCCIPAVFLIQSTHHLLSTVRAPKTKADDLEQLNTGVRVLTAVFSFMYYNNIYSAYDVHVYMYETKCLVKRYVLL